MKAVLELYWCPECGEMENLHENVDYNKSTIDSVLCNECGHIFKIENGNSKTLVI